MICWQIYLDIKRIDIGDRFTGDLILGFWLDSEEVEEMLLVLVEAGPQDVDLGLLNRARPAILQLVNVVDLFPCFLIVIFFFGVLPACSINFVADWFQTFSFPFSYSFESINMHALLVGIVAAWPFLQLNIHRIIQKLLQKNVEKFNYFLHACCTQRY